MELRLKISKASLDTTVTNEIMSEEYFLNFGHIFRGKDGKDGIDGKTAYQYAIEGGFTGSEEAFEAYVGGIGSAVDETRNATADAREATEATRRVTVYAMQSAEKAETAAERANTATSNAENATDNVLNAIGTAIQAADRANEAAEAADAVRNELALALHIPITHASLLALRNAGELTKGAFYRITDYECTTTQADTRSANHPFDIFVQALDERTLSENASAIQRDGDTYFAGAKLEAWQLKYTIDNDATRFAWADSEGKGIIYRMIDEHDNDCPYDFKNLQFYNNGNWYYTFSQDGRDLSLTDYCVGNYILPHTNQNFSDGTTAVKTIIPMVVFDMKSNASGKFAGILHNNISVPMTKGYFAGTRITANEWYDVVGGGNGLVAYASIISSGIIYGNHISGPCSNFEVGTTTPISAFYANNIILPNYQIGVFKCSCSVFNNNTLNLSEGKRGFTITSGSIISCEIENSNYARTSGSTDSDDITFGTDVVLRNSRIRIYNDLSIIYGNATTADAPLRFLDIDARGWDATTIAIPSTFPVNANYELKVAKDSNGEIKMWCEANSEHWEFTLADGTVVTKNIVVR